MRTIRPLLASVLAAVPLLAQESLRLPVLFELGPTASTADPIEIAATAKAEDLADTIERLVEGKDVVLRIDARVPCAVVESLLTKAAAKGLERVHCCARLPDGREGLFTLALPQRDPIPTLTMRLHAERPGVAPTDAVPPLRRMRSGLDEESAAAFAVRVAPPASAPWSVGLAALSAVAAAGVERAVFATHAGPAAKRGSYAIDLAANAMIPVVPIDRALDKPAIANDEVGCSERAGNGRLAQVPGIGGGRYAGRRGAPNAGFVDAAEVEARGLDWACARLAADGMLHDAEGRVDVFATGLLVLALLGEDSGSEKHAEARLRAIGGLLAHQHEDGAFAVDTRDHAIAVSAVATGLLLNADPLLCGPLRSGDRALAGRRNADFGYGRAAGQRSDLVTTYFAHTAIQVAELAKAVPQASVADGGSFAKYLDRAHPRNGKAVGDADDPSGDLGATAAALYLRYSVNYAMGMPAAIAGVEYLEQNASTNDPLASLLVTQVFYLCRSANAANWAERLDREVVAAAEKAGEDAGNWPATAGSSRERATLLRILSLQVRGRYFLILPR